RLAHGECAGLVEGDRIDRTGQVEVGAALEEDAVPRAVRDAGQDRGWRGDDEGARARNDEQRHGAVERVAPVHTEEQWRCNRSDGRGYDDTERIRMREAVDEVLCRRALFARFLHESHDARE